MWLCGCVVVGVSAGVGVVCGRVCVGLGAFFSKIVSSYF